MTWPGDQPEALVAVITTDRAAYVRFAPESDIPILPTDKRQNILLTSYHRFYSREKPIPLNSLCGLAIQWTKYYHFWI
jgi:hypothetical protein